MGTRSLVLGVMDRSAGVCACVCGRVFGAPYRRPFNHGREDDLRADREAVLTADIRPGTARQYASDDLRADREVILTAANRPGPALQLASDGLGADRGCRDGGISPRFSAPVRLRRPSCRSRSCLDGGQSRGVSARELWPAGDSADAVARLASAKGVAGELRPAGDSADATARAAQAGWHFRAS